MDGTLVRVVGQYSGAVLAAALALAWATIFVPGLLGNWRLAAKVGVVSAAFLAVDLGVAVWRASYSGGAIASDPCYTLASAALILVLYGLVTVLMKGRLDPLPIFSVLFMLLTVWAPLTLNRVARAMWTRAEPRAVPQGDSIPLSLVHAFILGFALFLSVYLWVISATRSLRAVTGKAIGAGGAMTLLAIVFYLTVPGSGDEGVIIWILLVPAGVAVAAAGILTCLLAPLVSWCRGRRGRREGRRLGPMA